MTHDKLRLRIARLGARRRDASDAPVVNGALERETDRVLRVYAEREGSVAGRYRHERAGNLLVMQQLERILLLELAARLPVDLSRAQALDVGCGGGGWLVRLASHGVPPDQLHGVDLRPDVIARARRFLPSADVRVANAAELPHADHSMDLVTQFTMLSSVDNPRVRLAIAREMCRVVKPGGVIASYDFSFNPKNRNTRGVTRRELADLFDGHDIDVLRVTLAPPLARLVTRRLYAVGAALQSVPLLRTHRLAFITPRRSHG